ncbi:futalosine hydrolase [Paenibacillus hexagrammi]|uniref:Futalosine hydrolase n=1 Tax=Paenibacillus hexagrammi TaxID=2908839 RepID=A0ABY3SP75_9BACL|nr:futalosine hydrolase [Paenibacillus sp. YPD9-1]UJF35827.1 futalosine hydrolase [Paenibacillus sp. YPD9-1]
MESITPTQRVLVVTAVEAEKEAVLRGTGPLTNVDVVVVGVGAAAAAANTAAALSKADYGMVVMTGIAGGFAGKAEIGSIVMASEVIAADLGAETPEGFVSLDELGFGSARVPVEVGLASSIAQQLQEVGLPVVTGPVLTVTTVTGSAAKAEELLRRVPGAVAEAMEGYGAGVAAQMRGIPFMEFRAISNTIGPRDRSAWRIGSALTALEAASSVFREVR